MTRIKPISTSRAALLYEYRKILAWWKPLHPICCVPGCGKPAKDTHHRNGKIGILLIIHELFRPLCREHHDKLKQPGGVEWGRKLNLLPPVGGHNTIPEYLREKYIK